MKKLISLFLAAVLLAGCAQTIPPADSGTLEDAPLAEAVYPEMAPYPNERDFIDPKTGVFDNDGFSICKTFVRFSSEFFRIGYAISLELFAIIAISRGYTL